MIVSMAQFILKLFLEELVVVLCMIRGWLLTIGRWLLSELGYAIIRGKYQTIAPEGATGTGMLEAAVKCIDDRRSASKRVRRAIIMIGVSMLSYAGIHVVDSCPTAGFSIKVGLSIQETTGHSIREHQQSYVNEPKEIHEESENYRRN